MMSEYPVKPVGWRLLIEPVELKETTDSGIQLPKEALKAQEYLRYVGKVIDMGSEAYSKDSHGGHWCEPGDYVAFGQHAGQEVRCNVDGEPRKLKLINDDEVLAVITDPDQIVTPI